MLLLLFLLLVSYSLYSNTFRAVRKTWTKYKMNFLTCLLHSLDELPSQRYQLIPDFGFSGPPHWIQDLQLKGVLYLYIQHADPNEGGKSERKKNHDVHPNVTYPQNWTAQHTATSPMLSLSVWTCSVFWWYTGSRNLLTWLYSTEKHFIIHPHYEIDSALDKNWKQTPFPIVNSQLLCA